MRTKLGREILYLLILAGLPTFAQQSSISQTNITIGFDESMEQSKVQTVENWKRVSPYHAKKLFVKPTYKPGLTLSSEREKEIKTFISKYDKNGNGSIDPGEYTPSHVGSPLFLTPTNVTFENARRARMEEHKSRMEQKRSKTPTQIAREAFGQAVFLKFDLDKDGTLNEQELATLQNNMQKEGEARYQILLKWYDTNNDGIINEAEILKLRKDEESGKLTVEKINQEIIKK